jgi:hypothetical protein
MALTTAQLQALKAHIAASGDLNTIPAGSDGNAAIAALMNVAASPAFTVWRKSVSIMEVGDAVNGTELAGLSSLNNTRLQTLVAMSAAGVNPSLANRRQFFDDIFSGAGGVNTRAALLVLWKRPATRAQKLFSTGTGSDASPATTDANVGDSFAVTGQDVDSARNIP